MRVFVFLCLRAILGCALCCSGAYAHRASPQLPAVASASAAKAMMLAATHAGARIVAAGEHGIVLLSDDGGVTFRQARRVPTRATLTALSFVNAREGWAVGHLGVVLHSSDGGDTWTMQREDTGSDRPLFAVAFQDEKNGLAAGLWSLLLRTGDGGKTWEPLQLPAPPGRKYGNNLFDIWRGPQGDLFIAAERGALYRSADGGGQWRAIATGNTGAFWTGLTLRGGAMLVAGLRGKIYRSTDGGKAWTPVASGTTSSLTGLAELSDGRVSAVGLDGVTLESGDGGASFSASARPDQRGLTALVAGNDGMVVRFSSAGVEAPGK